MGGVTTGPGVFTKRFDKVVCKRFTLSNAAGSGAIGTVALLTITGSVLFKYLIIRGITTLTGTSATIALGTATSASNLIAATTATSLTAGKLWASTSPTGGVLAPLTDKAVNESIILTVATANVTGGAIEVEALWLPLSSDGNVA